MSVLSSTLIADGSSDAMLLPIIQRALQHFLPNAVLADTVVVNSFPKGYLLEDKIKGVLENFPCDLLFIHRDAEANPVAQRLQEIDKALEGVTLPCVAVVPVKMSEAWLLVEPKAIKLAVGNPNSDLELNLPLLNQVESCNAKTVLDNALTAAANLNARRRRKFSPDGFRHRVGEVMDTRSKLLRLPSYVAFEARLSQVVGDHFHDR
jgi:hypothetical protein